MLQELLFLLSYHDKKYMKIFLIQLTQQLDQEKYKGNIYQKFTFQLCFLIRQSFPEVSINGPSYQVFYSNYNKLLIQSKKYFLQKISSLKNKSKEFIRLIKLKMHMKYRQAAANLAKQTQLVKPKQVDPLSTICAERIQAIKKTKFIHKETSMSSKDEIKRIVKNELNQTLTKNEHQKRMKKRRKNHPRNIIHVDKNVWQKYLPQCSDQFQDIRRIREQEEYSAQVFKQTQSKNQLNKQENQSTNPIFNKSFQKQKDINSIKTPSLETVAEKQKFQLSTIDFQSLKQKLGIIKKQQVKVVVQQQKIQIKQPLKQSKNTALLPFAGRPFEQAPERPTPKMIYQYPPTCKVAGLYPWPPPKSQYRMWKSQMREARKLN